MGIFRNFPYSNFHDMNLDDIIKNIKELNIEFKALENKFENLITETHNYIREYLENIFIPTKTSDLINDSGFITNADVPTKTSDLVNDSGFITNAAVPTKTSDLINDSGFITNADVPTKTSDLVNDSGFITNADVPTKTSELINDNGFISGFGNVTNVYWGSDSWTAPNDGILLLKILPTNNSLWHFYITDSMIQNISGIGGWSHQFTGTNNNNITYSIPIKKTTTLTTASQSNITSVTALFYPLINN